MSTTQSTTDHAARAAGVCYFSDTTEYATEVFGCWPMSNEEFHAKFPGVQGRSYDSFAKCVGSATRTLGGEVLPITRVISYKAMPSLHECNSRCMGGKCNGACECRCGGKNHGRAAFTVV